MVILRSLKRMIKGKVHNPNPDERQRRGRPKLRWMVFSCRNQENKNLIRNLYVLRKLLVHN